MTTKPTNQSVEEIRSDLERRITEGYFVHCKIDKPEFKTLDEAKNWYDSQNFIAKKVVGSWVDNVIVVIEQAISQAKQQRKEMVEEIKRDKIKCKVCRHSLDFSWSYCPECGEILPDEDNLLNNKG